MKGITTLSSLVILATVFSSCANVETSFNEQSIFYSAPTKEAPLDKKVLKPSQQYENPAVEVKESKLETNFEGSYNQDDGFE